jgi:GDPmannose 4,6-dehydratase
VPTALITGITGQDGGYLAEALTTAGWRVAGALRRGELLPAHLADLGSDLRCREVELQDPVAVEAMVHDVAPDVVYNLAGVSSVADSWADPVMTVQVNTLGALNLLQACWTLQEGRGREVRFLQASSGEIFAGSTVVPQDESTQVEPTSPYGASKAAAQHLVQVFRSRGMHAVNAILYNHESPRRPPTFVTRKITSAVAAIVTGQQDKLVLGNVGARRDWGWAPEYVDALVLASSHSEPDDYVIATGVSHTVEEFVAMAFQSVDILDWRQYVSSDPSFERPTDGTELRGRPQRAADVLGWKAQVPLEETVARMVAHDLELLRTS